MWQLEVWIFQQLIWWYRLILLLIRKHFYIVVDGLVEQAGKD